MSCLSQLTKAQRNFHDTTLTINKQPFRISTSDIDKDILLLKAINGTQTALNDTVESGGLFNIELLDFNKDGNADIMLTYGGNNFSYFLYLFDASTNKFKNVDAFENFPDAIH